MLLPVAGCVLTILMLALLTLAQFDINHFKPVQYLFTYKLWSRLGQQRIITTRLELMALGLRDLVNLDQWSLKWGVWENFWTADDRIFCQIPL